MNNYCTNCGKKLERDALKCKSCNTPIIDLSENIDYKKEEKKKILKKIVIVIGIYILCFFGFEYSKEIIAKIRINKLKKEYVIPFVKENYGDISYSVKYDSKGKCIISGDCYFDPVMGCDGGGCHPYKYLPEESCTSYYFQVITDKEKFIVTVVHNEGTYSVVEGKNIYGADKKDQTFDDNSSNVEEGELNE